MAYVPHNSPRTVFLTKTFILRDSYCHSRSCPPNPLHSHEPCGPEQLTGKVLERPAEGTVPSAGPGSVRLGGVLEGGVTCWPQTSCLPGITVLDSGPQKREVGVVPLIIILNEPHPYHPRLGEFGGRVVPGQNPPSWSGS